MTMPTCYSKFLNESPQKQQIILPSYRCLKAEDICGKISEARFIVSWYRHRFHGYKLNSLFRWCLNMSRFTDEVLGIYLVHTQQ